MDKLDPKLAMRVRQHLPGSALARAGIDAGTQIRTRTEAEPAADEDVRVFVKYTGDPSSLRDAGFHPHFVSGDITGGTIALSRVVDLAALDNVVGIELSRPLRHELFRSVPEIGVTSLHDSPEPLLGKGVVVGIIDNGVDYRHAVFRHADGKSRIVAIWDQQLTAGAGEAAPTGFTGGVEYRTAKIDEALALMTPASGPPGDPFTVVRTRDEVTGHGTHVAGIAAGNGLAPDACRGVLKQVGVAPAADLVVVKLQQRNNFADSVDLVAAIQYVFAVAGTRPAVVNMSVGDQLGPHDGQTMLEQAIDNALGDPGRAIVHSAGNDGDRGNHASGSVTTGATTAVTFKLGVKKAKIALDFWYPAAGSLNLAIRPAPKPGDPPPSATVIPPGEQRRLSNGNIASVEPRLAVPPSGLNEIYVELIGGPEGSLRQGTWSLELTGNTPEFHCWAEVGDDVKDFFQSLRDNSCTIIIPGTSREIITVASYNTARVGRDGALSKFSSHGPARTPGHQAPTIAAPGSAIISARTDFEKSTCSVCCQSGYTTKSGTSMAAPHVAGVVALMFERDPTLTQSQIRDVLTRTARRDDDTEVVPNNLWGYGKVDAVRAVGALLVKPPSASAPSPRPLADGTRRNALDTRGVRQPARQREGAIEPSPVERARQEVLATPAGQRYAALAGRHLHEVLSLVNHNRRVATKWHRNRGPLLLDCIRDAVSRRDVPLVTEVDGRAVSELMAGIVAAFRRHGSDELRAAIDAHAPEMAALAGLSFDDLLAQLRSTP